MCECGCVHYGEINVHMVRSMYTRECVCECVCVHYGERGCIGAGARRLLSSAGCWPKPYIYTVYDRIFGDFPAKDSVYAPYIYGSGQPYSSGFTGQRQGHGQGPESQVCRHVPVVCRQVQTRQVCRQDKTRQVCRHACGLQTRLWSADTPVVCRRMQTSADKTNADKTRQDKYADMPVVCRQVQTRKDKSAGMPVVCRHACGLQTRSLPKSMMPPEGCPKHKANESAMAPIRIICDK